MLSSTKDYKLFPIPILANIFIPIGSRLNNICPRMFRGGVTTASLVRMEVYDVARKDASRDRTEDKRQIILAHERNDQFLRHCTPLCRRSSKGGKVKKVKKQQRSFAWKRRQLGKEIASAAQRSAVRSNDIVAVSNSQLAPTHKCARTCIRTRLSVNEHTAVENILLRVSFSRNVPRKIGRR